MARALLINDRLVKFYLKQFEGDLINSICKKIIINKQTKEVEKQSCVAMH